MIRTYHATNGNGSNKKKEFHFVDIGDFEIFYYSKIKFYYQLTSGD